MKVLHDFARWLLVSIRFISKPDFLVSFLTDHPSDDALQSGLIYIVASGEHRKWAYFRCPSDQSEVIQLSLMQERRPNWNIEIDWLGRPTISPSVRQITGSYAHFWIKEGRVDWCADTGPRQEKVRRQKI